MSTLTQRKRNANPVKYARKDARTLVLRLVYGSARSEREVPHYETHEDWLAANARVHQLFPLTHWDAARTTEIAADMQRLNPKNAKAAA